MIEYTVKSLIVGIMLGCLYLLFVYNPILPKISLSNVVKGMETDDALRYIESKGYCGRVVQEDSREYVYNQAKKCFNLFIKNGKVYKCFYK